MRVTRLYAGNDPMYPYEYCVRFDNWDTDMMYSIADHVLEHKLGYWVGCLTGVIYVKNARDVTFVQLQWQDL